MSRSSLNDILTFIILGIRLHRGKLAQSFCCIFFGVILLTFTVTGAVQPVEAQVGDKTPPTEEERIAALIEQRERDLAVNIGAQTRSTLASGACQLGATIPWYAIMLDSTLLFTYFDEMVGHQATSKTKTIAGMLDKAHKLYDLYVAKNAAEASASGGSSLLIMRIVYTILAIALLNQCPPRIVSINQDIIENFLNPPPSLLGTFDDGTLNLIIEGPEIDDETPRFLRTIPGNPQFDEGVPTNPSVCSTTLFLDKERLLNPRPFDTTKFGDFSFWGVKYPSPFDIVFDQTAVWETNIDEIATSIVDDSPGVLTEDDHTKFTFDTGTHTITFHARQILAVEIAETRNLRFQELRVEEPVPPVINYTGPEVVTLEAVINNLGFPPNSLAPAILEEAVGWDDCTPTEDMTPRLSLSGAFPLGDNFRTITVTDNSGNSGTHQINIRVVDTIPPDIFPPDPLGVVIDSGTGILGSLLLSADYPAPGQGPLLQTPLVFDLNTLRPELACTVGGVPCEQVTFPRGETKVTWTSTDQSGNSGSVEQLVFVKLANENNPPIADPQNVLVATGIETPITLTGSDPDFDKLFFFLNSVPDLGGLGSSIEPIFQTRFSINGLIGELKSIQLVDEFDNDNNPFLTVADPVSQRLIISKFGGNLIKVIDLAPHNICEYWSAGPKE